MHLRGHAYASVTVGRFTASRFRCLQDVDVSLSPNYNLFYGANASGKTSLLEALAYLGRCKSFRGAPVSSLIQHGEQDFVLFAQLETESRQINLGIRNSRDGFEARLDNQSGVGAADMADALPLQIIDPEIHSLVSGGPELRRKFVDWLVFHVEPTYLDTWRRFRRALKQRNAALKGVGARQALSAWDAEFVELGLAVDDFRRRALDVARPALVEHSATMLGATIGFDYASGWASDLGLAEALEASLERDVQQGSTQVGPHRADLRLRFDDRAAKRLVSRGQQKLLASAMILAATETAQDALEKPLLLLMDDPAAELDADSLSRLMEQAFTLGCQLVTTSLDPSALAFPESPAVFHVEHGKISPVQPG